MIKRMVRKVEILVLLLGLTMEAGARTFTVINNCPFTIWPAMFTDMDISTAAPDHPTGWQADPYTSVSFAVPDDWKAGRIWGRRDCDFSVDPGPNSCLTGGCNGGFLCDPATGTGVPPVSVAEWTLQGDQNQDFYDVSLVDGYDLPMRIDNNVGCPVADCSVDLNPSCPSALQGPFDSGGYPLGCRSACSANLDGDQENSPNCCSGQFATPETCPPTGVAYYDYFKGNCPNAYAYAYDESSNTALWTCDSALNADYTLTFCPPSAAAAVASVNSSVLSTAASSATLLPSNPLSSSTVDEPNTSRASARGESAIFAVYAPVSACSVWLLVPWII